jgi:prephenate dehydrogenase
MCEANAEQLTAALDRTIYELEQARNGLAAIGSVADLVDSGHAAHTRYDSFSRPDISLITVGADDWRHELAAAGRAGGVIRSALPVRGSRG